MALESAHVLHHDRPLLLPRSPAHALPLEYLRAGRRALELAQSQKLLAVGAVDPVKANPPPLELQPEDVEQVGCVGQRMRGRIEPCLKLLPNALVALRLGAVDQRNVVIGLVPLTHISIQLYSSSSENKQPMVMLYDDTA